MDKTSRMNNTYISPRLAACLREIEHCQVTTIVAPMGYGKSTAVRWWRERYTARHPDAVILWQTLTGSSADSFWRGFCRTLRQLPDLAESMARLGFPEDKESVLLMAELLEDVLGEESRPLIYILDDIHYANTAAVSELLSLLLDRLPGQVRLILLSRNRILREVERFRLGGRLCQITMEDLRLRRDEILEYAAACGLSLSPEQAETLEQISEGWISFLYLLFRSYIQYGRWQFQTPDIFRLMDQVMFQPLDGRKKRFLLLNGMTDDFTREQAAYLWEEPDGGALLDELTQDNGFITCDGESRVYRFHNMLRNVVRSHFRELPETEQKRLSARLGRWYMKQGEYVQAAETFYEAGEWEELLKALVRDRSKSFGGEYEALLTKWSAQCPKELLLRCPEGLLILMLNFYSYHNIPEMMRIYGLFQQSMEQNREMDSQERRNLLGETEIMLSFLAYNDIAAMSAHHRRACELMNRPSSTLSPESPWTFGSPSILMAYHRAAGDMEGETAKMRECIPYYSRVTEGHGAGAEHVMEGEMLLMRGETAGAETAYHKAVREAARAGQFSILAAAAFLSSRLGLLNGKRGEVFAPLDHMEDPLKEHRQYTLLPTLDMCRGWLWALLGSPEEAPDWLTRENASSRVLMPAIPMFQIIVNQLLLARGFYSQAAARWEELHGLCGQYHSLLCEVYLELQTAAALFHLNEPERGEAFLKSALAAALPDRVYLPFAEVDDCLAVYLEEHKLLPAAELQELRELTGRFRKGRDRVRGLLTGQAAEPAVLARLGLSRRELETALFAAEGRTNQEIAEILFLSERTVKNHLSRVYDKLDIPGAERNKRARLAELLNGEGSFFH